MVLTPTGIPYTAFLGVASRQHPTYSAGFLGQIKDDVLEGLLNDGKNGDPVQQGSEWVQNFHKERLGALDGALNYRGLPQHTEEESQGRFDFVLDATAPYLKIIVKWFVELHDPVSSYSGGATENAIIDAALARANTVLEEFWGGYSLVCSEVAAPIELKPQVIRVTDEDDAFFRVLIFNDATAAGLMRGPDTTLAEVVNMENFRWNMRETKTFSAWVSGNDFGNGPHEFGHMTGLPHDLLDQKSVMFSVGLKRNMGGSADYQYKYGGTNRPYASHFKLAKLWADQILSTHLFPGHHVDCVVKVRS